MEEYSSHYVPAITGEWATEGVILSRAREFFLVVIQSIAPRPLLALRDDVLPKYCAALDFEKGRGRSELEVRQLSYQALIDVVLQDELEGLRSLPEFRAVWEASHLLYEASAELIAWSKTFNLRGKPTKVDETGDAGSIKAARRDAIWPLVAALETIIYWYLVPLPWVRLRNPPHWRPPYFTDFPKPPEILPAIHLRSPHRVSASTAQGHPAVSQVDATDWFMEVETETQFRRRMHSSLDEWLDRHVAGRKESAQSAGLEAVRVRRDLRHFVWAAKYQIDEVSPSDIVEEFKREGSLTKSAVEKAVKSVLDFIRLRRRKNKRGPSPKRGTLDLRV